MIRIKLPDNSEKTFDHNPTVLEVAESIGSRLAQDTLGGIVNDETEVTDFRRVLNDGDQIKIITTKDPRALEVIRHSAAHLMAEAVQELWPDVKVTIGPVIDDGFFYDFVSPRPFTPEDLEKIEKKMKDIIKRDDVVTREEWPTEKAIETFTKMGEDFKVEIIRDLNQPSVSIYKQGDKWFDLCRGPHVRKMGQIKAVKVLTQAGAYWRGDENKAQLQRIYATAFLNQKDLDEHLKNLEEAKKRDHRKLGKELDLFHFHPLSPGSPFFSPKGAIIYNQLVGMIREKYIKYGYEEVITPQVFDVDLFHQSGHYANYRENMYFTKVDERDFSMKPMNCPSHCLLYKMGQKSYRDLPWRMADFGRLHRYERSGVMHGLTRVRTFCQDDAHIFCTIEQMQTEIKSFMELLTEVYNLLGMNEFKVFLSTRPEKRMGSDEVWDKAEGALMKALTDLNIPYTINPGDGAFYGPKLDIMFVDALKRPWQLGTLQVDYNLPQAFDLGYVGEDNVHHHPVMLHRAILGSLERFIGVYLEHTAGHLPLWLAPVQMKILTLTDRQLDFGKELLNLLSANGFRAELDQRSEKLGYKIRDAQMHKIPYMIILGDKEVENQTLSLRLRNGQNVNNISVDQFIQNVSKEINQRELNLSFQSTNQEESHTSLQA